MVRSNKISVEQHAITHANRRSVATQGCKFALNVSKFRRIRQCYGVQGSRFIQVLGSSKVTYKSRGCRRWKKKNKGGVVVGFWSASQRNSKTSQMTVMKEYYKITQSLLRKWLHNLLARTEETTNLLSLYRIKLYEAMLEVLLVLD
jgi:hypothetical protein